MNQKNSPVSEAVSPAAGVFSPPKDFTASNTGRPVDIPQPALHPGRESTAYPLFCCATRCSAPYNFLNFGFSILPVEFLGISANMIFFGRL